MSPGEVEAASQLVGLAFADNPNALAVTRGNRGQAQRMIEAGASVAKLGRPSSHVLLAEQAGRVVGVLNAAEWPNCQLRLSEKIRTAPRMIRAMGSALPRQLKLLSIWARQDPRRDHWHLGPIGVHPELQGRGIGTALLDSFLTTVDQQGLPAYLETDVDRNVALYQTFGFEVIAEDNFNGVTNRFMWREPTPFLRP
jgi:ribosomal protein S18 acetylase RimI-like enzyme